MRMFSLVIGTIIGATIATNYDLRPVYHEKIKPTFDTGLEKLKKNYQPWCGTPATRCSQGDKKE